MSPFPKKKQVIELLIRKGASISDKNKELVDHFLIYMCITQLVLLSTDFYFIVSRGSFIIDLLIVGFDSFSTQLFFFKI